MFIKFDKYYVAYVGLVIVFICQHVLVLKEEN